MIYPETEIQTKDGRRVVLRNACPEDAAALLDYLKITATETRFLLSEPEEITLTLAQEEAFIQSRIDSDNELLLIATIDGKHIGNCALCSMGTKQRYRHRCSVSIALYQEYCGLGLGRQMMQAVLEQAKLCGYEQAELEVVADNDTAIALYQSLGFERYGTSKHNMKYKDGTYADAHLMVKYL